ncbi:hypothetical protein ACQ5SO_08255 [Rhodovulum sp. DZ06]|uniref:hypothetical protein n=1 Tax=Rhodovulum sp. DZ06 TaxID=3425126 RepID=UPI003D332949
MNNDLARDRAWFAGQEAWLGARSDQTGVLLNILTQAACFDTREPASRPLGAPGDPLAPFDMEPMLRRLEQHPTIPDLVYQRPATLEETADVFRMIGEVKGREMLDHGVVTAALGAAGLTRPPATDFPHGAPPDGLRPRRAPGLLTPQRHTRRQPPGEDPWTPFPTSAPSAAASSCCATRPRRRPAT